MLPPAYSLLVSEDTDALSQDVQSASTETTAHDLDTIEETPSGRYLVVIVIAAATGGLLFGFDTAIISSCLLFIGNDLGHYLKPIEAETITSVTSVTALLGSVFAGALADRYGRRNVLAACCAIFIFSAILTGFAQSVAQLVWGRAILGIAVGGASMVTPVFISEVSASKARGRLLACNSLSCTGGQLVAYLLANMLKNTKNNWRILFLLAGVPPTLFLLVVRFIPESPRYSVMQGDFQSAERALHRIYPRATHSQVQDKILLLQAGAQQAQELRNSNFWEVVRSKKSTQNALLVGLVLMFIQQCVGFNAFMYYSGIIFKELGFDDPIFASISIALTNFVFSFVPFFLVDKIGRRNTLLRTSWLLSVALFGAAAVYSIGTPFSNFLVLVAIVVYVAAYASGLGTIPWSSVELLPLEARAVGGTIIACCNWSANFVISLSYLSLVDRLSAGTTFVIFGVSCICSWIWIYRSYPDVTGIPLEQVSQVFEHGVDFNVARELRRAAKA